MDHDLDVVGAHGLKCASTQSRQGEQQEQLADTRKCWYVLATYHIMCRLVIYISCKAIPAFLS